jgi:hypothetical protein
MIGLTETGFKFILCGWIAQDRSVADCCDSGNEYSGYIKGVVFLNRWS